MGFFRKASPRRTQVRKNIPVERVLRLSRLANRDSAISLLIWALFVLLCVPILAFEVSPQPLHLSLAPTAVVVLLICIAVAFYIHHFQKRRCCVRMNVRVNVIDGKPWSRMHAAPHTLGFIIGSQPSPGPSRSQSPFQGATSPSSSAMVSSARWCSEPTGMAPT